MANKRIKVDAAKVTTVDELIEPKSVKGCIVRLAPSKKANEAQVKLVAEELRQHALAVKVLPLPASDAVVLEGRAAVELTLPKNTRAFLEELIDKSSSKRKTALKNYVSELADDEGI